jgi:phosphate-selective porin
MRSLTQSLLLLLLFVTTGALVNAQQSAGADNAQGSGSTASPSAASPSATKEEVNQLRQEIAEQRQTIEELKVMVQKLTEAKSQEVAAGPEPSDGAQLLSATLVTAQAAPQAQKPLEKPAEKKEAAAAAPTAGWNGDHFFIKAGDFQIMPNGYFQSDYRAYKGDGSPNNTFVIRRARFGFLGSYGKYYDYSVLLDAAASNGLSLRDLYLNIKPAPFFRVQVGQFKMPFAQEEMLAVTNTDFVERSLASLLYPAASTAYRSPGGMVWGELGGGVMQYWASAFNGKGILVNNTTNQPEVLARVRFYPWRKKNNSTLQGFAFGGAIGHGRARGLSNETSFVPTLPDGAYTFFPCCFPINGATERYNGEFAWVHGPWAIRGEYDQLLQDRHGVGSLQTGGIGFTNLPGIRARAGYVYATYLLTREAKPENAPPKVKHPVLGPGPEAPGGFGWGAWELAFRYDKIEAKEPGVSVPNQFTPTAVPTFANHTDAFTFGTNWYLNNWIKYQANLGIDRLGQPSTTGVLPQNYYVFLQRLQFRF